MSHRTSLLLQTLEFWPVVSKPWNYEPVASAIALATCALYVEATVLYIRFPTRNPPRSSIDKA